MNTAARMESNSKPGRVHISEETANLLEWSGKSHWLERREDKVLAKGKGELQTYWLVQSSGRTGPASEVSEVSETISDDTTQSGNETLNYSANLKKLDAKIMRLVTWNAQGLLPPLEHLAAIRQSQPEVADNEVISADDDTKIPLEEVTDAVEIIPSHYTLEMEQNGQLDAEVERQLEGYCAAIASMYGQHPFHSFEHASHVLMSVLKLFSRVEKPKGGVNETFEVKCARSYGLACDPLALFACLMAALVHDVDHPGVSNQIYLQENPAMGELYGKTSVAEQNSFDLSWKLLMDNRFFELRKTIFRNDKEKKRFRMLLLNACMATDVMDEDRKKLRRDRWERAFGAGRNQNKAPALANIVEVSQELDESTSGDMDERNRCATLVMEDLVMASSLSHTMQHFQVFRKWNARLFHECKVANDTGRSNQDPAEYWYHQTLDFFDATVIPLAQRLQSSGVFGQNAAGDEYLDFAKKNRREWEHRGVALVSEYQQSFVESKQGRERIEL